MKMRDILSAETKQQLEKETSPSTKEADPSTRQEWEEIMGTRRETYQRLGGRVRRKR
ncbi:hypothetical protein [Bacillus altitudinis]|uniref:hypothetical protein n=1 Tax=Bacillus altitudinis TaxID=293387 RepID=UPI003D06E29A